MNTVKDNDQPKVPATKLITVYTTVFERSKKEFDMTCDSLARNEKPYIPLFAPTMTETINGVVYFQQWANQIEVPA